MGVTGVERTLLELYDRALPEVYGYLVTRVRNATTAEDLTAETFLAAVHTLKSRPVDEVTVAWLIGIARHKLLDHWRRQERERRPFPAEDVVDDPWDEQLDRIRAETTLAGLRAEHRTALTLRYVDDLPVADVAVCLERSEHAAEALLARARAAFRRAYGVEHV